MLASSAPGLARGAAQGVRGKVRHRTGWNPARLQSDRVRVWALNLKPGERIAFHTHVLDYFWTAVTGGRARSHHGDGRIAEVSYEPGDTQHHKYAAGEFMIYDLENIGETELVFTTVEFLDSENAPLAFPQNAQDVSSRIEGRAQLQ